MKPWHQTRTDLFFFAGMKVAARDGPNVVQEPAQEEAKPDRSPGRIAEFLKARNLILLLRRRKESPLWLLQAAWPPPYYFWVALAVLALIETLGIVGAVFYTNSVKVPLPENSLAAPAHIHRRRALITAGFQLVRIHKRGSHLRSGA